MIKKIMCMAALFVPFPNDPDYKKSWNLFSVFPKEYTGNISEAEKPLGPGIAADLAWTIHKGSADMVIAILDSGIYWHEKDLVERYFLNRNELPLPENANAYDANGDGRFSMADYGQDSRVRDVNYNGVLDPEDLILIFSDGVDADENGFTDDICGWDFLENDNNPRDRVKFGHGTGEAKDSVATLGNGIGGAGVCGECAFFPVRVDDSFVVDANAFSAGVVYATRMGAKLIQQAVGSLNWGPTTQAAVDYAYSQNVIIIGTAADENSYHHNYPSVLDPIVYTNAIRYDRLKPEDSTTFLNFNNCSNLGARVDVATSALSCSSEATGVLSGAAGLAISYSLSLNQNLRVGEMISLIKQSATDINLGESTPGDYRYSSYEGWDSLSGYGRTNAYGMLRNLAEKRIPPEARIISPTWFALYRKGEDRGISVSVKASSSRSSNLNLTLEIAKGVETSGGEFHLIKEASIGAENFEGEFATYDFNELRQLKTAVTEREAYQYAYTFRFTVHDKDHDLKSEARRTVFIFDDARLRASFPKKLMGSGESSGLFADLNHDGKDEFITADGAGFVHAFTYGSSEELAGFPVATTRSRFDFSSVVGPIMHAAIFAPVAVSDLENNGKLSIAYATMEGEVGVLDAFGHMRAGFPVRLPALDFAEVSKDQVLANGILAAPVTVDLTGDGQKEIVVVGLDGHVYAYTAQGHSLPGFPVKVEVNGSRAKLVSSPAVSDVNGDGVPDLILGSNHVGKSAGYIFAIDGRGQNAAQGVMLRGFPARIPLLLDQALPLVGTGIPTSPVVADINQDGVEEIIVHPFAGKTYVLAKDGSLQRSLSTTIPVTSGIDDTHMLSAFSSPGLADLNGDGILDPMSSGVGKKILTSIALGGKKIAFEHLITAWDGRTGKMFENLPKPLDTSAIGPSAISADLDGDGKDEIIAGSSGFYLRTFALEGNKPEEAPRFTGGWIFATPSLGDFDGDGKFDLAATTREGYLFIWKTYVPVTNHKTWTTFKGSNERLGRIHSFLGGKK